MTIVTDISLDKDAAAARAAEWLDYAEKVERHGATQHVPAEQLHGMLGDIYAAYVEQKKAEYAAREAAYGRVAAQAREHAAKLMNTKTGFEQTDDEGAAVFRALIAD